MVLYRDLVGLDLEHIAAYDPRPDTIQLGTLR